MSSETRWIRPGWAVLLLAALLTGACSGVGASEGAAARDAGPAAPKVGASLGLARVVPMAAPASAATTDEMPGILSLPTATGGLYSDRAYGYSIDVPAGWALLAARDDAVALWESSTGATVWVMAEPVDRSEYATLDRLIEARQPIPAGDWTGFRVVSQRLVRTRMAPEAHEFTLAFSARGGDYRAVSRWHLRGGNMLKVFAVARDDVWDDWRYVATRAALLRVVESFRPA